MYICCIFQPALDWLKSAFSHLSTYKLKKEEKARKFRQNLPFKFTPKRWSKAFSYLSVSVNMILPLKKCFFLDIAPREWVINDHWLPLANPFSLTAICDVIITSRGPIEMRFFRANVSNTYPCIKPSASV